MIKRFLLLSVLFYSLFAGLCTGMLEQVTSNTTLHAAHAAASSDCIGCETVDAEQVGCCEAHTFESEELVINSHKTNTSTSLIAVVPKTDYSPNLKETGNLYIFDQKDLYIDPHKQLSLPKIE